MHRILRPTSLIALLLICGTARRLHAQSRLTAGFGVSLASVDRSSTTLAASADVGFALKNQPRQVFVRAQWWDTPMTRVGAGLYYGGRWTTHRFVYGEAGVGATASKDSTNAMTFRPAVAFALGGSITLSSRLQLRAFSGYLRDTKSVTYSLGIALCSCRGS